MVRTSPRPTHRGVIAALALALALALAGCASSGGSEGAASTTAPNSSTSPVSDTSGVTATTESPETTGGPDTTGTPDVAEANVCDALQRIADFDDNSGELVASNAKWSELQAFFVETTPKVLDAYDDAIAAGSDVTDELITLRDFTAESVNLAGDSTSLEDFASRLGAGAGLEEASLAASALNSFAEGTCGFSTGGI